jgi:hypothetical protein
VSEEEEEEKKKKQEEEEKEKEKKKVQRFFSVPCFHTPSIYGHISPSDDEPIRSSM